MKKESKFPPVKNGEPVKFPHEVKDGSSVCIVFHSLNRGRYHEYKVEHYLSDGTRKLESHSRFEVAERRAHEINANRNKGNVDALALTSSQRLDYAEAEKILKPLGLSISVSGAVRKFTEAQSVLGQIPVQTAADYYREKHPKDMLDKPVSEIVEEFLKSKRDKGVCSAYYNPLARFFRGRRGTKYNRFNTPDKSFGASFNCPIASIMTGDLSKFIDSRGVGARTLNNFRAWLIDFFSFAKRRGYLPRDWSELDHIESRREPISEIEIYSPPEVAHLLTNISEVRRPVLAICAFSGLRLAEALRLDWRDIGVGSGKSFIEVKAKNAKTRQRRLVPITDNLRAWLSPFQKDSGKIYPYKESTFATCRWRECKLKGLKLRPNALRHSYISYQMALIANENQVAAWAGNTPSIVYKHYRALRTPDGVHVTPELAVEWFSIKPDSDDKITYLNAARSVSG